MGLADERYLAFTTYRKSGEAVTTPVWTVGLEDGRLGFWTSMGSGKTKRLRNNAAVTVQPCSATGTVKAGATAVSGTAEMVQNGPFFDEVHRKIRKKYGFQTHLTRTIGTLFVLRRKGLKYADTVVLTRLDA